MKSLVLKIPFKFAKLGFITLLSGVVLFHLCVISSIIPYTIVWAGKLNSFREMLAFESISIAINLFLFSIVLMRVGVLKEYLKTRSLNIILWGFVIIFSLNTFGNLFAKASLETIIFTPLTFISALLSLRLILEK